MSTHRNRLRPLCMTTPPRKKQSHGWRHHLGQMQEAVPSLISPRHDSHSLLSSSLHGWPPLFPLTSPFSYFRSGPPLYLLQIHILFNSSLLPKYFRNNLPPFISVGFSPFFPLPGLGDGEAHLSLVSIRCVRALQFYLFIYKRFYLFI